MQPAEIGFDLIAEEMQRRSAQGSCVDDLHDGQRRFIFARDASGALADQVALLAPRRFGKTEGYLRLGGATCLEKKRARVALVYQLRQDAEEIAWPLLEELNEKYGWGAELYVGKLRARFPNGSLICLFGADDPRKHRKFNGPQWDLFGIDEAQDWYSDVQRLCRRVLPSLADRRGRLFMWGTPPEQPGGYFDQVTDGDHPEWTVVGGSSFENPHTAKKLREKLDRYRAVNPNIDDEPWVRRDYYGEKAVDTRKTICHVEPALNYCTPADVPFAVDSAGKWVGADGDQYVLVIDWGDERAAYNLSCCNYDMHPWHIFLHAETFKGMMIADHKERIQSYLDRYPGLRVVADPGGIAKAIVRELTEDHGLPIERAEKENKLAQIQMCNSDLSLGLIKIFNLQDPHKPEDSPIAEQWRNLVWVKNRRTGEREEGTPRDIHDTCLYARRFVANHLYSDPGPKPAEEGSAEWLAEQSRKVKALAIKKQKAKNRPSRMSRRRP